MSIQSQCREAMNSLAKRDSVFTEIDVVNEASKGRGWTDKLFREATEKAYIVLQSEYKKGTLHRFGPVQYQGHSDYARRGTKIVYAGPAGPKAWETPNGVFQALRADHDALLVPGRRPVHLTNRDDSRPWSEKAKTPVSERHLKPVPGGPPVDTRPLERKIAQLEAELNRYRKTNEPVSATPTPTAPQMVAVDVNDLVELLAERIEKRVTDDLIDSVKERVAEALIA
jgi:hypothetical protein